MYDGLVSHPGGIKDSHSLNTTETKDKWATWLVKALASYFCINFCSFCKEFEILANQIRTWEKAPDS